MLYSQINYLGCFLQIDQSYLKKYSEKIENFVKGRINIAKDRLYKPCDAGGLGLFNLNTFLTAQKCKWIKMAQVPDDNWKIRIHAKNPNNIFNVRSDQINENLEPIIFGIVKAFEQVLTHHGTINENMRLAPIYKTKNFFTLTNGNFKTLDCTSFGFENGCREETIIRNLTAEKFYINNSTIDHASFVLNTGLNIEQARYTNIQRIVRTTIIKHIKHENFQKKAETIRECINRVKKGSKHIRKIISQKDPPSITKNVRKLADNFDLVLNSDDSNLINSFWNYPYLKNSTRVFLFRLANNILGYNYMLQHFVPGITSHCTFCVLRGNGEVERETPLHLFLECPNVSTILDQFLLYLLPNELDRQTIQRKHFLTKPNFENESKNVVLSILFKLFFKYLYDCKLRKYLPIFDNLREIVFDEFLSIVKLSRSFERHYILSDILLQ